MGKSCHNDVLDGTLRITKVQGVKMHVCSGAGGYASVSAVRSASLASATMASTDYTVADGDSSGRKITTAQKASLSIGTTATATHVAITATAKVLLITTCTSQLLTQGGTVTVPAWKQEIADPT